MPAAKPLLSGPFGQGGAGVTAGKALAGRAFARDDGPMNKAFVRDPDEGDPRCPALEGCGGPGVLVGSKTLDAQLDPAWRARLPATAYYCPEAQCPVGYFDAWGTVVPALEVRTAAWPKSPQAPVCSCRGLTASDIEADARAGRRERIRELDAYVGSGQARCETAAPGGRSCIADVRRLFMRALPPP